jgi:glyoxylase I family protein
MKILSKVHHIAIIASDYEKSKTFYTEVLGLEIINETFRADRDSYKLDLALQGEYIIELFSFPNPPKRTSRPEAAGLRHLAFEVENIEIAIEHLTKYGVICEPIRIDEITDKKFTFFEDPDGLPLEFYER